jgi:rRNA maturation protein Nop10
MPYILMFMTVLYRRCVTCGRWIEEESRIADRFCSKPCAERYRRCGNCGGYSLRTAGGEERECPHCGHLLEAEEKTEEGASP